MGNADLVLPMIFGTALLTFGLRYLPMRLLGGQRLRPTLERLLRYLPIGILSALVAQSTFLRGGALNPGLDNHYLPGIVLGALLTLWTRSLGAVVLGGLALVGLLTYLGNG